MGIGSAYNFRAGKRNAQHQQRLYKRNGNFVDAYEGNSLRQAKKIEGERERESRTSGRAAQMRAT